MKYGRLIIILIIVNIVLLSMEKNIISNIKMKNMPVNQYRNILEFTYRKGEPVDKNVGSIKEDVSNKSDKIKDSNTLKKNDDSEKINTENNKDYTDKAENKNVNPKIGIIITNKNGQIFYDKVTFENKDRLNIYYGKNMEKKITECGKYQLSANSPLFDKENKLKICGNKNITIMESNTVNLPGDIIVYKKDEGLVVVNNLNLENYIEGVVASEMPQSFHIEALKAQAVCARTYAYTHLNNKKYKEYRAIMDDTVNYQAYGKATVGEKDKEAVSKTKDIVITSDNKLIDAYYFSTSCGYTTDYKIWGEKEKKYLKGIRVGEKKDSAKTLNNDYFDYFFRNKIKSYESSCAFYRWQVTIKENLIRKKLMERGYDNIGKIKRMNVERGSGGRCSKLEITGKKGKCEITNQYEIRQILSPEKSDILLNDGSVRKEMKLLPSAFFTFEKKKGGEFKIYGGGYGHGSGMSQNAANEMAASGIKYKKIIAFFYNDANCLSINTY